MSNNDSKALGNVPPNSPDAERMTLGNILLDAGCLTEIRSILPSGSMFYHPHHGIIFDAMCSVSDRGSPVDIGTISEELRRQNRYNTVGGMQLLGDLTDSVVSAANFRAHAEIVRERADERAVMSILRECLSVLQNGTAKGSKESGLVKARFLLNSAMERASGSNSRGPVSFANLVHEWVEKIERSIGCQGVPGIHTGIQGLDELTGGWQPGQLIVCGARPAMGKTAYSLLAAETAAKTGAVLVVSMEMVALELFGRCAGKNARVDSSKLKLGRISSTELDELYVACEALSRLPIEVDDTPGMSLIDVATSAARVRARHGSLSLIVVDYLQLMQSEGSATREQAVGELSRGLKRMAKDLRVPILVLAQLNRDLEKREDRRPKLSDLRESGAIEQDADTVFFLYRDEVYHPDTDAKKEVEFIVAKQRNGATDTIKAKWIGQWMQFEEIAQDAPPSANYSDRDDSRSADEF